MAFFHSSNAALARETANGLSSSKSIASNAVSGVKRNRTRSRQKSSTKAGENSAGV